MEERWIVFVGRMNKIEDFGGREEELSSRYLFSYLPFGEVEGCRNLDSSGSAQVLVEVEFFFQLEQLRVRVGRA